MTKNSKQIQNKVFSLKLRNGHYALLQDLKQGQAAIFDFFQAVDEWDVQLTAHNVLFIGYLTKAVIARSVVATHKNIKPVIGLTYPEITIDIGEGFRKVRVWEDTEDEREFFMMGNCDNCLVRVRREKGQIIEECTPIAIEEYEKYSHLELTNLNDYPSFNERLFLCELFGKNVDPLREIAFSRPLPREYRTYIDIISGKIPISKLGY